MGVEACVTKSSALDITMAWAFAMRSPRTLVYLPLRQSDSECRSADGPALDLVLLHHSLGFRLSKWTDVRAKLRAGRPHTVVCRGLPEERPAPRWDRETLSGEIVGSTVFVVGSRPTFQAGGQAFRQLVDDTPTHAAWDDEPRSRKKIGLFAGAAAVLVVIALAAVYVLKSQAHRGVAVAQQNTGAVTTTAASSSEATSSSSAAPSSSQASSSAPSSTPKSSQAQAQPPQSTTQPKPPRQTVALVRLIKQGTPFHSTGTSVFGPPAGFTAENTGGLGELLVNQEPGTNCWSPAA